MTASRVFLICLATLVSVATFVSGERKNWVLLIAGSATYDNYRHQADVCHAYQIMHANGIKDENIVVMMYDDIANNSRNPFPGNIINKPGGSNVYPGVPKDYTGEDVNAKTFLKVLQGDKEGIEKLLGRSGKVIDSGPDDYIFVNFADHGGPGILGMPHEPYLKAKDLNDALKSMHENKKFAKLVFYVEACYSGSVFDGLLPDDINIYVTTAANPHEGSVACYWDDTRKTYLGDLYSVNWMENTDASDLSKESLEQQFKIVKQETNFSHCMQYGDQNFTSLKLDQFFGTAGLAIKQKTSTKKDSVTPVDDAIIDSLERTLASVRDEKRRSQVLRLLEEHTWLRSQTQNIMELIASVNLRGQDINWAVQTHGKILSWNCYEHAVDLLIGLCPRLRPSKNDYILKRLNVLVNLCNARPEETVLSAVERVVRESPFCY